MTLNLNCPVLLLQYTQALLQQRIFYSFFSNLLSGLHIRFFLRAGSVSGLYPESDKVNHHLDPNSAPVFWREVIAKTIRHIIFQTIETLPCYGFLGHNFYIRQFHQELRACEDPVRKKSHVSCIVQVLTNASNGSNYQFISNSETMSQRHNLEKGYY